MIRLFAFCAALLALAWPAAAAPYKADPGPYAVETLLGAWHDETRDRDVPYKIYYAPEASGARPVVVFSHGLGGSREGAAYLGEHLASYGYVAVHIQHPGSDASVWAGMTDRAEIIKALVAATKDVRVIADRFKDVPFALDQLTAMNAAEGRLKGRIDLARLGMSGHSFGAVSTLVAAGQKMGRRAQFQFKEPRFRAAIAYSPNKPMGPGDLADLYADMQLPILHFTGTEDRNPLDPDQPASDRQIPFRNIPAPGQYLIVIDGGDHILFGGKDRRDGTAKPDDDLDHRLILEASIAFWDAYLLDDPAARAWLRDGGAQAELGAEATLEMRN
jgi:predicted dienelactone hydrolase